MEKIVVWKEFRDFRATTEENYNARIMDLNKVWEFNHTENYETFDDVVDTIEKWFNVDRKDIIIKGGE